MKNLRQQLIEMLGHTRSQQHLPPLPAQLAEAIERDFYSLLVEPADKKVALRSCLVSHDRLHRHVISIRCPDQAFYLDAIKGYFIRHHIQTLEQQTLVAKLECGDGSCTIAIRSPGESGHDNLMFIALHISATLIPNTTHLVRDLRAVLQAVELSVLDFSNMKKAVKRCANRLKADEPEVASLLKWMRQDRYLFFGMQIKNRRLGLLRNYRVLEQVCKGLKSEIMSLSPPRKAGIEWLHLAASQHYLYSMASLEVVRISWKDGNQLSTAIVLGRFSRSARNTNSSHIPLLSRQWKSLLKHPLLTHSAFYMREIRTLYDRLPKPLLLSMPVEHWLTPLKTIIDLTRPMQTHTSVLKPSPGNVYTLMSALPADRLGPNVLASIVKKLREQGTTVVGHHSFGVGQQHLLLLTCTCRTRPSEKKLAETIQSCVIFWKDRAKQEILQNAKHVDVPRALADLEKQPKLYQELFPPDQFLVDMQARAWVLANRQARVHIHKHDGGMELHIFTLLPLPLGQLVATVQNFGLTALQEAVIDLDGGRESVRLTSIRCTSTHPFQIEAAERLGTGLEHVLNSLADDDAANALVLSAGLDIHQVTVMIALRNHLIQLLPDAAPLPLTGMLNGYPKVSAKLYRMFEARHRPAMPVTYEAQTHLDFEKAMTGVLNLTDDRWFRALAELVQAGLRSNAYAHEMHEPVSIKIAPAKLSFAPHPCPYREIFVHGTHLEGVHLRSGPIARGGIRYSDRPADFRTEVLELMATQVEKNGLIVPTGAKGGFVIRGGIGKTFVQMQYRTFIRALLSLTDNRRPGRQLIKGDIRIQEEDRDDTYLVVAADKGTASFSNLANAESKEAGFWLGDAFASGGRYGYDHKEIGITAKGAWVCAAEHFASLGIDAYSDPISVIGIGGMNGDVFGNGMLLNPKLKLVGAFNHKEIFIDPDPDPKASFEERERLFAAELSWDQYNRKAISNGGDVFPRMAKSIPLSPRFRKILNIEAEHLSGEALIRAMLEAPVDLLYNGGIGAYIRANSETDANVRDPANNSVRISADRLHCRVVCEGGNLGLTQKARIEFSGAGGLINTDAIDNSGGVDMSDHEVNLKVMMTAATPPLKTAIRNRILKGLAPAITEQCLANCLHQSRSITLAENEIEQFPFRFGRLRDTLVKESRIDPQVDPDMADGDSLDTRPQLAVLLGHEKNRIQAGLVKSNFARMTPFRQQLLQGYFPQRLRKRFSEAIDKNPLADEITATAATNLIVNHLGISRTHLLQELLDSSIENTAHALLAADALLETKQLRRNIWQQVSDRNQAVAMLRQVQELVSRFAEHLLRLCPVQKLSLDWIHKHRRQLHSFRVSGEVEGMDPEAQSRFERILSEAKGAGLDANSARHFAALPELAYMGIAVHLGARHASLKACLRACQAVMQLLPLSEADWRLRQADWGQNTEYELRKEWLNRLTRLAGRATHTLLETPRRNPLAVGHALWARHHHWTHIQQLHQDMKEAPDRMNLILLLTLIENLIDETEG